MKSQNATATIETASACSGDTVYVPVNATDFINIGAMTIYIGHDTASAEFLYVSNTNPAIPGSLTVNANNGQVGIAYSNISGFTITSGKLFDLNYILEENSTLLTFNPGTEIANTNLVVIPLDTNNGAIYNGLEIVNQPDSVQAYPDTDVTFTFLVSGTNIDYQWEENSGSGWIILQNNTTYSGVDSETLTVFDVPLSFNGNTYRCLASKGECEEYSQVALLEVNTAYPAATIGQVASCPEETIYVPVYAGDFFDVIEFTFNIGFNTDILEFTALENVHDDLLAGTLTTGPLGNPPGLFILWQDPEAVTITSGKLFDMKFEYTEGPSALSFVEGTQVINSLSNPVNITLTNGYVSQYEVPTILTQPSSQTIQQFDAATFLVEATQANAYQWQVSQDAGQTWTDLANAIPYYNVTTHELTVDPVTWDLHGYQYSCLVANDDCEKRSESAILSVDTLTWTGKEISHSLTRMSISPNPASDVASIHFTCESPCAMQLRIMSLSGNTIETLTLNDCTEGINRKTLDVSHLYPGAYVIELVKEGMDGRNVQYAKLIKIVK